MDPRSHVPSSDDASGAEESSRGTAGRPGGIELGSDPSPPAVTTTPDADAPASSEAKSSTSRDPKKKPKKGKGKDNGIGSSRGVETLFRTSYRTHLDLTALADNKANIMISINGLILSIVLASISPKLDTNAWLLLPTTTILLSCLAAIIYAILAARPRVNTIAVDPDELILNRRNILFFGNYTQISEDQFLEGVKNMLRDTDLLYPTMMRDLYAMGRVLDKKFRLLRTSYTIFMIGITISVLAFVAVFATEIGFGPNAATFPGVNASYFLGC